MRAIFADAPAALRFAARELDVNVCKQAFLELLLEVRRRRGLDNFAK